MKVNFFWSPNLINKQALEPDVGLYNHPNGFKCDIIANFLNDDEGLGLNHLKEWFDEGLIEIEKIKRNELDFYDMWGQAWGAEITKDNVLIYWGYDDTEYEENMPFETFYTIIKKWREFIDTEPSLENKVTFVVPD